MAVSARAQREIQHGERIAARNPELVWGWATAAGQLRARRRAALIAKGAGLGPGVRALEVGCGSGLFTEYFAATGAEIVAVDISEDLLEHARARHLDRRRVSFVAGRVEDLDGAGSFDAVVGSSVLHHLEIDEALRRLAQLLKPRGRLSVAEPNMLNPQIVLERRVPYLRRRLNVSPDETAFVRWSFSRTLARHGFTNIHIEPFDWLHPLTPPPLIPAVLTFGRVLERLPGVRELAGSLWIACSRG